MPIPVNSIKYVIGFTLPGGEIAQTAWWLASSVPPALTDASVTALSTDAHFTALMAAWQNKGSSGTTAISLDGYGYTGGPAATSHGHAAISYVGTGASPHPHQVALVTTLRTATFTRSGRGRMYWPANGCGMSAATGLATAADVLALVNALALLFTWQASGGAVPSVVSQTTGTAHTITSVDADQVLDTMRRRSNKLHSTRQSHTV